jgi:hypothetical protein
MKVIDYNKVDGTKTTYRAKWFFSRVLEGRAIQDVFVCPEFTERSIGMSKIGNRYGSSFRMFDTKSKQWRVDWFNPVNGVHSQLVARKEETVFETDEIDGLIMRWVFEDIQPIHFTGTVPIHRQRQNVEIKCGVLCKKIKIHMLVIQINLMILQALIDTADHLISRFTWAAKEAVFSFLRTDLTSIPSYRVGRNNAAAWINPDNSSNT